MRRVYLVWMHPLFHESVRRLLDHPDVALIGSNSDPTVARHEIESTRPDIVVVEEIGSSTTATALTVLEACTWDVAVVTLNLNDNSLSVYHRKQEQVGTGEELLGFLLQEATKGGGT